MFSQTQQTNAEAAVLDYTTVYNTHVPDASSKKLAPDIVISSPPIPPTGKHVEFGLAGFSA